MDARTLPPLGRYNFVPHAHECMNPRCQFIWAHDPNEIQDETEEIFDAAHDCPQCGTHVSEVYDGTRKPAVIHDGAHRPQSLRGVPVQYIEAEDERRSYPRTDPRELLARLLGWY